MTTQPINFEQVIQDLKNRLYNIENTKQPYLSDWLEISEPVQYSNFDVMLFSNAEVLGSQYFSVGDKVRWKQTGDSSYRYGYIYARTDNRIGVTGGTNFSISNAEITELARGLTANPLGFPGAFDFNPGYRVLSGTLTLDPNFIEHKFWMTGEIVSIRSQFQNATLSTANSSIVADLPIAAALGDGVFFDPSFGVNNFMIQTAAVRIGGSVAYDYDILIIENPGVFGSGFANWATSTNGVGARASFNYLADTTIVI